MLWEYRIFNMYRWRCDEVDGECDRHTYLYIEAVAQVGALKSRKWMETVLNTNNMNVYR